ncbi:hypothetical protein JI739_09145 [Ramlibacter sp. AW1]|uniref:Uncharacterized protein n=1 Tax=Ramlibacter aurantiacus TaxID=2801330 RepID=A0A936ZND7_9BURK|nr:hypothetical protein [Ramlibacter aurantiacus]MBL0420505.1 hypothetical protein [Ramlibacter aurantiacus]
MQAHETVHRVADAVEAKTRRSIAFSANYEVLLLARTLTKVIEDDDRGSELATVARGMLRRIQDLSEIVYEAALATGDDRRPTRELQSALGGEVRHD